MSLRYLCRKDQIYEYVNEVKENELEVTVLKKLRFLPGYCLIVPGHTKCYFESLNEMQKAILTFLYNRKIVNLIRFATTAVVGEEILDEGRTFTQELLYTVKVLCENNLYYREIIVSNGMWHFLFLPYALQVIDTVINNYENLADADFAEKEILRLFYNRNGYKPWYHFFENKEQFVDMYRDAIDLYTKYDRSYEKEFY